MVIDAHYHLDQRLLRIDQLKARMHAAGVDKVALMAAVCDPFPETHPTLIAALQFVLRHRQLRPLGRALAARFTREGDIRLPRGRIHIHRDPDNEPVFAAVKQHPATFLGWVFVNPAGRNDPLEELARWQDQPGFAGVKTHSFWHRHAPLRLAPLAEQLVKLDKPLLNHLGFGPQGDIGALIDSVPGLKLILAHAAFPQYQDTWRELRDRPDIYVDLSQTSYISPAIIRAAVEYLGVERCIFGSDGPFGPAASDGLFDCGLIKGWIEGLYSDPGVRRRLLGENFAELTGLAGHGGI